MEANYIKCPCFEVNQPIGKFYIAKIRANDLVKITTVDRRKILNGGSDLEIAVGIQRELADGRVNEIAKYINTVDATFPSSIILAVNLYSSDDSEERSSCNILYDDVEKVLSIKDLPSIAKILDGQHRIEGLNKGLDLFSMEKFEVIVTIFVDADPEQQAIIFSTINKSQTKVNKSLVYDLLELAKTRSPEKTCHNIAILLNKRSDSPFFGMIKILGIADSKSETITQSTFVEWLVRYITDDPVSDKDILKRNPNAILTLGKNKKLFLRPYFIGADDGKIAAIVFNYFSAVKRRWPTAWAGGAGSILNKSTGYISLTKFLKDLWIHLDSKDIPSQDIFFSILNKSSLDDADFTKERFIPGGVGISALYNELLKTIR